MSLSVTFSYLSPTLKKVALLTARLADDFRNRNLNTFPHKNILPVLTAQLKQLDPDAKDISERTFERAKHILVKQGILEITKPVKGYQANCYRININAYEIYPNLRKELKDLINIHVRKEATQKKKFGGILQDRYVIDIADSKKTQHKFINFNLVGRKERTLIDPEWKACYETRYIIKYTYSQIGDFYIQAAEEVFRKKNLELNNTSDDWNNKFKHFVFMSIRKGWRTISWAAWKLQKECNQKNQSVIDTQPRVVMTEQFEILKNAIAATTDRRRSMANILLSGTTLVDNKLNVSINANTAREWAQYLPTIKEYMKDISYKAFAGVEEISFVEV